MKKLLLLAIAAFTLQLAQAQTTLFAENFTTGIPNTWTVIDNDQNTPHYSWINNGWVADLNTRIGAGYIAVSSSWYATPGTSDDWMITPAIVIPAGSTNTLLFWYAAALDVDYPDGYEVKLATNHGNTIADFTTTLTTVATENDYWTQHVVDLSSYAGDTITLAWRNNSNDKNILLVDDIRLLTNVPNYNLVHQNFDSYIYLRPNENTGLQGSIFNAGFDTVKSFKLNYTVNGGTPVSTTVSGISIPPYEGYSYNYPSGFTPTALGGYNLKMYTSDINGNNADSNTGNDSLSRFIQAISNNANKRPVFEEFTGAWCGYCPDGHLKLEQAVASAPALIPVSIHSQNGGGASADRMTTVSGDSIVYDLCGGFPTGVLDAVYFLDEADVSFDRIVSSYTQNTWFDKTNDRLTMPTPVSVSLLNKTYNATTRELSVTVSADFLSNVTGDYRVNLYLTEDSVVGSGSGYDQHNYFSNNSSGGSSWAGSPYVNLDDPIIGWAHMHVLRRALGGAWGNSGVIPTTVASGSNYTKTYTYTLPAGWRENFVNIVGLVEEYNSNYKYRNILNAEETKLTATGTAVEEVNGNFASMMVYPNPAINMLKVGFELKENSMLTAFVSNALGQKVADLYNGDVNTGAHTLSWYTENVANGIYFVTLKTETAEITRRFVVNK